MQGKNKREGAGEESSPVSFQFLLAPVSSSSFAQLAVPVPEIRKWIATLYIYVTECSKNSTIYKMATLQL